jgi:hypothetical protein
MTGRWYTLALLLVALALPATSFAQNPHFAGNVCEATQSGSTLTVSGHIVGLGNQKKPPPGVSLTVEVTGSALCLDPSTTPPTLVDASTVAGSVTYPPKNGERKASVEVSADFDPACAAPNQVSFVDIEICDVTHSICCNPGAEPAPEF